MQKIASIILCLLLTGCGIHYYMKSQAQQFSELAAQVATEIRKVPEESKALELDVYANLLRVDRGCAAINGNILALRMTLLGDKIVRPEQFGCAKERDMLASCMLGKDCRVCTTSTQECREVNSLAKSTRHCVHRDVATALAKTCQKNDGGGLWSEEQLYGKRSDAAANAYVEISDVASAGSAYIAALSSLTVDREESAAKYVTDTTAELVKVLEKLDKHAGTDLAPPEDAQDTKAAIEALLSLTKEWSMVRRDANEIRALVAKQGVAFEESMSKLSASADFIQKTYYQTLLDAETSLLTSALRGSRPSTTDGEAVEIQKKINELKRQTAQLKETRPISAVISKTVDAHRDLRRIAASDFTKEERQSVMQENIRQFSRLLSAIRDLTKTT
jgi:hypothetical protein